MAKLHRGVAIVAVGIVGAGLVAAKVIPEAVGGLWDWRFGKEEKQEVIKREPAFAVKVGDPPPVVKEEKEERQTLLQQARRDEPRKYKPAPRKATLSEKWLDKVNSAGMYVFGEQNNVTLGAYNSYGACSTLQPLRVRAMIADSGTTDNPGIAMGIITEDVQGTYSDGTYCVAIHESAVVAFQVKAAGDFPTSMAPVQVEAIWMEDGHKVEVGQPAKHVTGLAGVPGKVKHHTVNKVLSAIGGTLLGAVDNISQIGQFSSGDATDPIEDAMRKRLERPSEVTFTGQVVEFDLFPTSTPGYEG